MQKVMFCVLALSAAMACSDSVEPFGGDAGGADAAATDATLSFPDTSISTDAGPGATDASVAADASGATDVGTTPDASPPMDVGTTADSGAGGMCDVAGTFSVTLDPAMSSPICSMFLAGTFDCVVTQSGTTADVNCTGAPIPIMQSCDLDASCNCNIMVMGTNATFDSAANRLTVDAFGQMCVLALTPV